MKRTLPYLILVAEAVLFFRHVLFLPGYIIPWDLHGLHVPYGYLHAEALSRGEFPFWDPYTYCGRPFFATIQAAVLYPTVWLAAWAGSIFGREHIEYLLELSIVLHVALAGIFAYLLARRLGLSMWAALCGATVYELSGFFAAHAEHMGVLICAAWLPLAWYAALRSREQRGLRPLLLLAAIFALSIFSGNPPGAAFVIGFTLLFALLQPKASWRLPVVIAVAAAFAVLLTAVQLVPTYELTGNSVAKYRGDYLKGGVPPQAFVSLLLPNHYHVFDPPHYNGPADISFMFLYIGLFGLALAIAGSVLARKPGFPFVTIALCSAIASLGDMTRVTHAIYAILPSKIVIGLHPELATGPFTLALAMLAALGIDRIAPKRLQWLAVPIAAIELIAVNSGRPMNAMPSAANLADSAIAASLRALIYKTNPPARIDTIHDSLEWSMKAPQTGVYTAGGADVMAPERIIQVRLAFAQGARWGSYYQVENPQSPVVGMMNVRYLLTDGRTTEVRALDRFRLVTKIRRAQNMEEAAAILKSDDFKPAEEAIVEGDFPQPADAPPGRVEVVRYGLQSLELKVTCARPQFLVTSETHYPGWRAWIDGRPQPIYYTDVAFRGLFVPAGKHSVTMRFQPTAFTAMVFMSGLSWLVLALLWFLPDRPS